MWWWNSRRTTTTTTTTLLELFVVGCCCLLSAAAASFRDCVGEGDNTLAAVSTIYAYKNLGWLIGSMLLLPGCLLLLLPLSFSRRCRLLGTIGRSSPTPCAWPSSSSLSLVLRILYDVRYGAAFRYGCSMRTRVWYGILYALCSH